MWTLAGGMDGPGGNDAEAVALIGAIGGMAVVWALVLRFIAGRRRREPRSRSGYS